MTCSGTKYGVAPLDFRGRKRIDYSFGPEDSVTVFVNEVNKSSVQQKQAFRQDIYTPGIFIDLNPNVNPVRRGMVSVVHSVFDFSLISPEYNHEDFLGLPTIGKCALVEVVSIGYFYGVYEHDGNFSSFPIRDFFGSANKPAKVIPSLLFHEIDNLWIPTSPDALGTRIGGNPLNADGSSYNGPWPYTDDGKYTFTGQYQLDDGRYIHLFDNYHASNYDYSSLRADGDPVDLYAIALIEGEDIPPNIVIQNFGERSSFSPNIAYAQSPYHSIKTPPPTWLQADETPHDAEMQFLIEYGETVGTEEGYLDIHGEAYLFWNKRTGKTKILIQST